MTSPSDPVTTMMDANETSRLSAILIWVVAAAIICVAATWPRWHNTRPANATNSSSIGSSMSNASPPAVAPAQNASSGIGAAPPVVASQSTSAAVGTVSASSVGVAATHHPRTMTPPQIGDVSVPASVEDWQHLNDKQHIALAPFVDEWAHLPDSQKRKWLAIAAVYPRMSPEAQQRLHARMLRWVQMTPDERTMARENYQMSRVLPAGARQEAWRAYEALSPAQKAKLAAAERSRRRKLVVSAVPGTRPLLSSRDTGKRGLTGPPATLTTEKLVPLGAPSNAGTQNITDGSQPAAANAGKSASASQPTPSSAPDLRGTTAKNAKGVIGNLNLGDVDRP